MVIRATSHDYCTLMHKFESQMERELVRRLDSERELFTRHRICKGQRLRPLNGLPNFYCK